MAFVVRSSRVVLSDGERPAAIAIDNGVISRVTAYEDVAVRDEVVEAGDLVVLPGLVDTHVHVNEPGRAEWEGFDTATRAAAAGGVTTLVDMPLNSVPPTTSAAAFAAKIDAARGRCHVDVAFWGGLVPGNASELESLAACGARGFKCFLAPSGVDEFPCVDERDLREVMPLLAQLGLPLLVHAELPVHLTRPSDPSYEAYLASRPPAAEVEAIGLVAGLAREFGVRMHIVHVSSSEGVDEIARAKRTGAPVTGETCPHYLTIAADEIPSGATEFKCAPPIRDRRHRDALRRGLTDGTLDLIATDHSPAPPALKCPGDFVRAWGGIASLELSLAAAWTAFSRSQVTPRDLVRWMSESPARLAGLSDRKGHIAAGYDADLAIWDAEAETTVDPRRLQQRHKMTPYAGRRLRGRLRATFVRGRRVWEEGSLAVEGSGRLL
jgi:allantoinase